MLIFYGVVLYNKNVEDSLTYQSLHTQVVEKNRLIIFDNSTNRDICHHNKDYCGTENIVYISHGKNVGISKAYNNMIDFIKSETHLDDSTFFVTLDDDTTLPNNYCSAMREAVSTGKAKIYLPVVYSNGFILSPSMIAKYGKIKMLCDVHALEKTELSAINTGACYNLSVFDDIRFDERLFLDEVDHAIFRSIRKSNFEIEIVENVQLHQNYSQFEEVTIESKLNRFEITMHDLHTYTIIAPETRTYLFLSCFFQSRKNDRNYSTKKFSKVFWTEWRKK